MILNGKGVFRLSGLFVNKPAVSLLSCDHREPVPSSHSLHAAGAHPTASALCSRLRLLTGTCPRVKHEGRMVFMMVLSPP